MVEPTLDEIGRWSEIKLDIVREYAKAYSTILANQPRFRHVYIDGFAGAGLHVSKTTKATISGSPMNVINVLPRFREYHLVELDPTKAQYLRGLFAVDPDVRVHPGDCNDVVLNELLPQVRYDQYRRALCLLDPYGLHLDWRVLRKAGELKTVDLLLNFPIMDMNMNALLHDQSRARPDQAARMTRFWGDESWKNAAYGVQPTLFGDVDRKADNMAVVKAFQTRLKEVGGFRYVPDPIPMRNSTNAVVYYLFFASANATAEKIIKSIFRKYQNQGAV